MRVNTRREDIYSAASCCISVRREERAEMGESPFFLYEMDIARWYGTVTIAGIAGIAGIARGVWIRAPLHLHSSSSTILLEVQHHRVQPGPSPFLFTQMNQPQPTEVGRQWSRPFSNGTNYSTVWCRRVQ